MVSVSVSVFVALTVSVSAGIHLCGVEHECHVLEAVGTVVGFEGVEHAAFEQTGANDEHGAVNVALGYERLEGVDICYEKGGTKKKAYRYAMTKDAWQARRAEMLEILMG